MYLKSIDIHGFKTFAQKTTFVFKPGVTAIVGPNGCGKSNIVDAIRWVLGETNARSLRGEVMEDIIFSGSEDKKPLGMAEVGITIVNDDNFLPIEYSEVTVKRRLFRSGESEFFINKNQVRLRDVHELFADTGIGKFAYSVMEQGNVDVLLSNRPEERMTIFEEAAGITRYKTRIKESYRKLETTEENILRLNLIINEVEKEYNNLEKQAEKANRYKLLKNEEIKFETLFNYERVQALKGQVRTNESKLDELLNKRTELEEDIFRLNELIKRDIEKVRKIETEIIEIKNETYKKEAELETIHSKSSHISERIHEIDAEISKKRRLIEELHNRRDELLEKVEQLLNSKSQVHDLIVSQEDKLQGYQKEIEHINELIQRNTTRVLENTEHIESIGETSGKMREELKGVIDKLLHEIDIIKVKYSGSEKKKRELIGKINASIKKIDSILKHHGTRLQDLEFSTSMSGSKKVITTLTEKIRDLRVRINDMKKDFETVINLQEDLSRVLFGKESPHTKKKHIEETIENFLRRERDLKKENARLNDEIDKNREKKENFEEIINGIRPDIARNREKEKHYDENIKRLKFELENTEESLQDIEFEIHTLEERKTGFQSDISRLNEHRDTIEREKLSLGEKTKRQNDLIDTIVDRIQRNESITEEVKVRAEESDRTIEMIEIKKAELTSKIETIYENFSERYSRSLELFNPEEGMSLKTINEKRTQVKNRIEELGQVNLMAIEEFSEVKKRYEFLTAQKEDLERAKNDLNTIVEKTLKSSRELFMDSFEKVKNNFNSIFRRLFSGGSTDLYLTNEANIFDTGVEIMACPPGKSLRRRSLLSGGEKSLTAIALLFSVFMVRPSPFCMLDEVDHDLDEENVLRFLKLLKEFTDTSQFVIITHNRRTIEFADVIYGITSEQAGISKVVSLEMMEHAVE